MTPVVLNPVSDTAVHLRQTFAAQLPRRIEEIARQVRALELEAWNPRRVDFLHRLVHSLSGSAATFGMEAVASVAGPLEVNLARLLGRQQAPKTTEIQRIAESFEALLRVVEALLATFDQHEAILLADSAAQAAAGSHPGPRIFLLHDIPEQAQALAQILHDAQYQVDVFSDLASLCQMCEQGAWPALIVFDLAQSEAPAELPETIACLRRQGPPHLHLIMVCARNAIESKLALYRAGVNHCLNAPLQVERLLATLAKLYLHLPAPAYRVLLLTHDVAQRTSQVQLLEKAGVQVQAVDTPLQLVARLEEFDAELIVLDTADGVCELASLLHDLDPHANLLFQSAARPAVAHSGAAHQAALVEQDDAVEDSAHAACISDEQLLPPGADGAAFVQVVKRRAQHQRERRALLQQMALIRNEREREHDALNQHAIVSMTDGSGKIIFVNDKFCRLSGYSRAELIGHNHRMLKSGQHQPAFYQDLWRSISHGHIWHGEICNRNKEGGLYWLDTTIAPFLDAQRRPYQFLAIRTEVSAHKEREKELYEAQRQARLGGWDDHSALGWSDLMADMLTRTPVFAEEGAQDGQTQEVLEVVHRVVRADGQIRYVRESGHSQVGPDGRLARAQGSVQDVTDHAAEMPRQGASGEHAAEEFAGRSRAELLSNMSQQLRTPLSAILAYAQMLQQETGSDATAATVQTGAHEIVKTGQQLLALINDVLDLARVASGRMDIRPAPVAVQALFLACEAQTVALAASNGISLGFDLGECVSCMLWADAARLKQVLLNLIANAIKYNRPHGKVHVSCCLMPASLGQGGATRLQIAVSDTGYGLGPEKLERLYTPFDRLGAEQSQIRGSGIGLLICRQLLQLMGGQMGVESTPGLGATFWLELALAPGQNLPAGVTLAARNSPAAAAPSAMADMSATSATSAISAVSNLTDPTDAIHLPQPSPTFALPDTARDAAGAATGAGRQNGFNLAVKEENMSHSQRKVVLYIEDNAASQRLMHKVLAKRGDLEMVDAMSAEIGLPLAQSLQPALILLDINLPGVDGYQALGQLRAMPGLAQTPVVAVTANAMKGDAERGLAAGFTAYVAKPLDIEQFYILLDHLLGPAK